MKNILISEVLDDLDRGLTRTPKSKNYIPELGSIQEKYELTNKEITYLFRNPKLRNRRSKLPVRFNLIDDTEEKYQENNNISEISEEMESVEEPIQMERPDTITEDLQFNSVSSDW